MVRAQALVWALLVACLLLIGGADAKVVKKKKSAPPYVPKVKKVVMDTPLPCSVGVQEGDILQLGLIAWFRVNEEDEWSYYDKREKKKSETLYEVVMGSGFPIQGWHDSLGGHCVHDMLLLYIPPELGYGVTEGYTGGSILSVPQNATLKHKITIEHIIRAKDVEKAAEEGKEEL